MTTTLDPFQTALLAELREVVRDNAPVARPVRRSRRRVLTAAAMVALLAGAGLVLPAALGDRPAYAVVEGANGAVDVRVDRLEDAAGLQRALRAAGVRADITYLPVDTACADGRYVDAVAPDRDADFHVEVGSGYRVRLAPGAVATDQTLVISGSRLSGTPWQEDGTRLVGGVAVSVGVAAGRVAPCVPVPATS